MYGLVNKAIENMVRAQFGDATWEDIKSRAGITTLSFISNEPYPDDITYSLVSAASDVLALPADQILEEFGKYWVLNTAKESYPDLMATAGRTLPEFLQNLNNLHVRVGMLFPKLKPPRFVVTDVTPTSLRLHHHTERLGLASFTIGLLKGLATMFETEVTIAQIEYRARGAERDVFELSWKASSADG